MHDASTVPNFEFAEITVDHALRSLDENRYFVFRDLVIPTKYKDLTLTQIDHVIVSHRGIFCIETKSNQGNIYGYSRSEIWKQYIGNKPFNKQYMMTLRLNI